MCFVPMRSQKHALREYMLNSDVTDTTANFPWRTRYASVVVLVYEDALGRKKARAKMRMISDILIIAIHMYNVNDLVHGVMECQKIPW